MTTLAAADPSAATADAGGYTARHLSVLEGLDAVRKRPGMYIGSTDGRGLQHCLWEIFDNSVDEALAGHCSRIEVVLHADGSAEVRDNGRGIPVDVEPKTKLTGVELVMTRLHAGGKFGNGSYTASGGLHGVGASVVNALTSRLDIEVDRDGRTWATSFRRGVTGEFTDNGEPSPGASFTRRGGLRQVRRVAKKVTGTRTRFWPDRQVFVRDVSEILHHELEAIGVRAELSGRSKNVYSIIDKMGRQQKEFEEIYDLMAVRVVVDSVKDCYTALGVVHHLWKPIPGRFKDYIAMPKGNGYQSLHTTVISHTGEPVEVQIRTVEMHHTSEYGVAAHWHYKAGSQQVRFDERYSWLRLLMDWQKELLDAEAFVDTVKVDIFQDEVFVFTPKGDVRSLPAGSTAVDFAYRVHTAVGHHCIGAKVNSRMVPLDYRLVNGDIVEILTTKAPHGPSRDWLNFVKTSTAREKIRQWFKKERREENVTKGREMLDKEFRRLRQTSLTSLKEEGLLDLAREFKFPTPDDFLAAIGYGELSPRTVVLRHADRDVSTSEDDGRGPAIPLTSPAAQPSGEVRVHGVGNMLTTLGRCCKPVPGEPIRGYITRGKGVTVHRASCVSIQHAQDPDRLVEVEWERGAHQVFPVSIKVEAWDRTGLLRDIAAVIAESKINLVGADVQVYDDRTAVISTSVEISNLTQLSRLLERLEQVRDVHTVARDVG